MKIGVNPASHQKQVNTPALEETPPAICWQCASPMEKHQRAFGNQFVISHWVCPVCDAEHLPKS